MKYIITILLISLFATSSIANVIDFIKTDKEAEDFIHRQEKLFEDFVVANVNVLYVDSIHRKIADSLGVKPWQKADFDNNGLTDLLVYGQINGEDFLIVFLDEGNRIIFRSIVSDSFDYLYFPIVAYRDNLTLLILHKSIYFSKDKAQKKRITTKTLIYKFGDFIEPNLNPTSYKIERIEFSTSSCLGSCPVFELKINSDKQAELNAIKFNDMEGKFRTVLAKSNYDSIVSILNYIDFPKLENNYAVDWTDNPTCTLVVTYDNGKTKKIIDYGLAGTSGLSMAYDKLFKLRKNQKWIK